MSRHGENIHQRKDGRWEARVPAGKTPDGKTRYHSLYGKTYREVKEKKQAFQPPAPAKAKSTSPPDPSITVRQLMEAWLSSKKASVKESTYANYLTLMETYLFPTLGSRMVSDLTTEIMDAFFKELLISGRKNGQSGLSPKLVTDIRSVFLLAIDYAKSQGYPCGITHRIFSPKHSAPRVEAISRPAQEQLELLLFASDDAICRGILLALYAGLRIGEVCGLQWGDIHPTEGTLYVQRTLSRIRNTGEQATTKSMLILSQPKTDSSIRRIPLPEFLFHHLNPHRSSPENYLLTDTESYLDPRIVR